MPRDNGTFYLDTDASDKGVGAVLSQEQDGREVLDYASRTLSKAERNYDVTRRELLAVLAVVFGLKTYRQYQLGQQFAIRTDHSASSLCDGHLSGSVSRRGGKLSLNSFLLSSFIVLGRDIRMLTRSRGDLSWMIVSPLMNRVKPRFVELS